MYENRIYRMIPAGVQFFEKTSASNRHMVEAINENGGTFEVVTTNRYDGDKFVTKVKMANGVEFSDQTDTYFELAEDEFQFFEEVVPGQELEPEVLEGGPVSMTIEVTAANAEAMIKLIKKVFNK